MGLQLCTITISHYNPCFRCNILYLLCLGHVRDPTAKAGGLYQTSTATRHTSQGVPLWSHGPTHQGVLTRRPFSPSLAGQEAFASRYYAHRPDQHGGCTYTVGSDRQRASRVAACSCHWCSHIWDTFYW